MISSHDLRLLGEMRTGFLNAAHGLDDYWKTPSHLGIYDQFFAGRIGWKWLAVLVELQHLGFSPTSTHLVDWGCGTGMASRCFLDSFPNISTLTLHDRSPLAVRFASEKIRQTHPLPTLLPWSSPQPPGATYLISHVINELTPQALEELIEVLIARAESILWVEPGTHLASHQLIAVRQRLLAHFSILAPCPHAGVCGLLTTENAPHWCHHFTRPPSWVHHDPAWSAFARELVIDLSSVPYSYLVLSKRPLPLPHERSLGRPRFFKGHAKLFTCEAAGVSEKTITKSEDPARLKSLRKW